MATKVHMEALSPTMEEGQLVRWLKVEGEPVAIGEILAEIETDKATMELVARGGGILRKILLKEGGTAPVGAVIGVIAAADEDIGGTVGEGEVEERSATGVPIAAQDESAAPPAQDSPPPMAGVSGIAATPALSPAEGRLKASPLARRLAQEAAVDLGSVRGSGPRGRIIKRDVEDATSAVSASGGEAGTRNVAWGAAVGTGAPQSGTPGAEYEDLPLSQMRKTIARRLVESIGPVPHFFLRINVDMTRTLEARKRVNALLEREGEKVSINDFVLKATAQALARHPEVNSHWNGESVRRHYRVHLGVAVAVEDGLITPVVRDAHLKGLARIGREVRELAARGQEKRLQSEEYTGSTFSVSNLGMFGIHEFTAVINPPEGGILAVGGVEDTPVVEEGRVVVRPLMKVTMSCDHRVVDGATGARFLQTLKAMLEEPATILV